MKFQTHPYRMLFIFRNDLFKIQSPKRIRTYVNSSKVYFYCALANIVWIFILTFALLFLKMENKFLQEFQIPFVGMKTKLYQFEYLIGDQFFENFPKSDIQHCDVEVKIDFDRRENFFLLTFFIDGNVEVRPMMYLAFSYDHRVIDGSTSVTFLVRVKELLEYPILLMADL